MPVRGKIAGIARNRRNRKSSHHKEHKDVKGFCIEVPLCSFVSFVVSFPITAIPRDSGDLGD